MPLRRGSGTQKLEGATGTAQTSGATSFRVFLNYRREDASGHAGRLYDFLRHGRGEVAGFRKEQIFMDIDTIAPGVDFRRVIEDAVGSCDVFIAVVGRRWLDARDADGRRRLDKGNDFVRLEIEAALTRDIPVVPVLVQGAQMPTAEELPETLDDFAHRNAVELSDARWDYDVGRLAVWLSTIEEEKPRREQAEWDRQEREERERREREERKRLEEEAAQRAERERLEVAQRAEQEQREAAERAEGDRKAREAAERAERTRLEKEAAEEAERQRLAKEAAAGIEHEREATAKAEAAEGERREGAEAEPLEPGADEQAYSETSPLRIRRSGFRLRRSWIGIALLVAVITGSVILAIVLTRNADSSVADASGTTTTENLSPSEAQRQLLSHIPANIRKTCFPTESPEEGMLADLICDMPNLPDFFTYQVPEDFGAKSASEFAECDSPPEPWAHGRVCFGAGPRLTWNDTRFRVIGEALYPNATLKELREEWRCCLQLDSSAALDIAEELRSLGQSTIATRNSVAVSG
jgi:hypothetical protein